MGIAHKIGARVLAISKSRAGNTEAQRISRGKRIDAGHLPPSRQKIESGRYLRTKLASASEGNLPNGRCVQKVGVIEGRAAAVIAAWSIRNCIVRYRIPRAALQR